MQLFYNFDRTDIDLTAVNIYLYHISLHNRFHVPLFEAATGVNSAISALSISWKAEASFECKRCHVKKESYWLGF